MNELNAPRRQRISAVLPDLQDQQIVRRQGEEEIVAALTCRNPNRRPPGVVFDPQ
ncbi:hypothetical protein L484_018528 [Morus notabilis]|uniref:Uncharacterized protein n=1 Tax=Morus notabilis TaxID=981085 RepID=W9SSK3_9ROSA|nr:hypothetical protein L484_018528 [Morus notabilis]